MQNALARISYLKGLAEGSGLDSHQIRDRLLVELIDVVQELADEVDDLRAELDDEREANLEVRAVYSMITDVMRSSTKYRDAFENREDDPEDEIDADQDDALFEDEDDNEDDDFTRFMRGKGKI